MIPCPDPAFVNAHVLAWNEAERRIAEHRFDIDYPASADTASGAVPNPPAPPGAVSGEAKCVECGNRAVTKDLWCRECWYDVMFRGLA